MKKLLGLFILVLLLHFILADYTVEYYGGGDEVEVDVGENIVCAISVMNNGSYSSNITKLEVQLDDSFEFMNNSQGTDASANFSYELWVLKWESQLDMINPSETKTFWFTASATEEGNFTLPITLYNLSSSLSYSLDVYVIEGDCTPNWNCTNWSDCENRTQTRECIDLNYCNSNTNKPSENQTCETGEGCISNWICSDWSECLNGIQTRTCNDANICGNETGKPAESQTCEEVLEEIVCQSDWNCTEWSPVECPKNETLTRKCTDINNCGDSSGKPAESQTCEYHSPMIGNLIFTILAVLVFCIILFVLFLIFKMKFLRKVE